MLIYIQLTQDDNVCVSPCAHMAPEDREIEREMQMDRQIERQIDRARDSIILTSIQLTQDDNVCVSSGSHISTRGQTDIDRWIQIDRQIDRQTDRQELVRYSIASTYIQLTQDDDVRVSPAAHIAPEDRERQMDVDGQRDRWIQIYRQMKYYIHIYIAHLG